MNPSFDTSEKVASDMSNTMTPSDLHQNKGKPVLTMECSGQTPHQSVPITQFFSIEGLGMV